MNKSKFLGFTILLAVICVIIAFDKFQNLNKLEHEDFVEFKIDNPNDEIEIINKSLKIYLDKMHKFDNFDSNFKEISRRKEPCSYELDKCVSNADFIYRNCNGNKKHDDKCEFMTFDKRLDLEYLMKLGDKICINGEPIENAKQIIENDEILQNKKLFYPQDEEIFVNENGNFIINLFYNPEMYKNRDNILFYNQVFLSKKYNNTHTNKDFDIIIPIDENFRKLFLKSVMSEYPLGFCQEYNKIITSKESKEKLNFIFIPLKLTKNGAYDILTLEDIFYYRNIYEDTNKPKRYPEYDNTYNEYDNIFNQYQTLKNNNFNKNLNLQGDGNAKN